jgi:hypothetical protein
MLEETWCASSVEHFMIAAQEVLDGRSQFHRTPVGKAG